MKIVHIDETFHPSFGYQVNPLAKFQSKAGHDVTIVTVEKNKLHTVYREFGETGENLDYYDTQYQQEYNVDIIRVPVHKYISNRAIYKNELFRVIDELRPDVVFVHLFESYASIRFLLKRKKYPLVFDSHMLAMASENKLSSLYNKFYQKIISAIVKKNNYKVIRTQDDDYVIKKLGVPANQAPFISFGSDTSIFKPSEEARKKFRDDYNISNDDFVVVYTGKLTEEKGALFLANTIKEKIVNNKNRDVVFVIVGNGVDSYGEKVENVFSESKNRIIRFPSQKYTDLPKFYQAADLSIFPKQCSLSFYDAQACGLPVLSENNNINIERLKHENGKNFKSGDMTDFRNELVKFIEMDINEYNKMSENSYEFIKENYDYEDIAAQYNKILVNEYERFKIKVK